MRGIQQPAATHGPLRTRTLLRRRSAGDNDLRRPHHAIVQLVARLGDHHDVAGRHVGRRLLQDGFVKIRVERLAKRRESARTDAG